MKWVNHESLVSKGRERNVHSLNGSLNFLIIQILVKLQVKSEFLSEINLYGQEVNSIDNLPSQSCKKNKMFTVDTMYLYFPEKNVAEPPSIKRFFWLPEA